MLIIGGKNFLEIPLFFLLRTVRLWRERRPCEPNFGLGSEILCPLKSDNQLYTKRCHGIGGV